MWRACMKRVVGTCCSLLSVSLCVLVVVCLCLLLFVVESGQVEASSAAGDVSLYELHTSPPLHFVCLPRLLLQGCETWLAVHC
jgi:hypothetical protein